MKQVLLVAYYNSHLPQFVLLAKFIQHDKGIPVILVFQNDVEPISPEWQTKFLDLSIQVIDRQGRQIAASQPTPLKNPVSSISTSAHPGVKAIKRIPGAVLIYEWWHRVTSGWRDGLNHFRKLQSYTRDAHRLLVRLNPGLIILPEENAQIATTVYTKNARRLNIGSIITPYTIADVTEFAANDYDDPNLRVTGWWRNLLATIWPQWTYAFKDRRLSLQTWPRIIAMELLRLAPPLPGMVNSGFADIIIVESDHMLQYYLDRGLPRDRLVLTGSLSDDALALVNRDSQSGRAALNAKYSLDPNKPLLVSALPPPWILRPEFGFRTHVEVIDFWMKALGTVKNYNILIHLHPRLTYDALRYIENDRVKIARTDITKLLPLCDLYVASISATIRWAIACGKPVINYDVNHYGLHDYDYVPGVITINTKEAFVSTLQKVTGDPEYYSLLSGHQQHEKSRWGLLDGRCADRLWQTMQDVMARHVP